MRGTVGQLICGVKEKESDVFNYGRVIRTEYTITAKGVEYEVFSTVFRKDNQHKGRVVWFKNSCGSFPKLCDAQKAIKVMQNLV